MDVSQATWNEIAEKLRAAGYQQAFHEEGGRTVLDLRGIALQAPPSATRSHPPRNRPRLRRRAS